MTPGTRSILLVINLLLGFGLRAPAATAQMIPLNDNRYNSATATYQGVTDAQEESPVAFSYWDEQTVALAEKYEPCENPPPDECLVGSAEAFSFQISQFYPAGIQFSGGTSGHWGVPPQGSYAATSISAFTFRVDTAFRYDLFADVDPGDEPPNEWGGVSLLAGYLGGWKIYEHNTGILMVSGRLAPGIYTLHGYSNAVGSAESLQGAIYSAQWTIQPVFDPIIEEHPVGGSVACGGVATFSVGTAGPSSNYTYQWRRNLVPLTNDAHISGATSPTLVINPACDADSGDYDVVVTGVPPGGGSPPGTPESEPSRLVHLAIVSTVTAVETEPASEPAPSARVLAASPNPFQGTTSVGYEAPRSGRLRATVYSITGAKIRTIADRVAPGAGAVTWDGRLASGARAPNGIYFIRLELGGVRETRKVVLAE